MAKFHNSFFSCLAFCPSRIKKCMNFHVCCFTYSHSCIYNKCTIQLYYKSLTKTSYWILIRWQPRRLVGGRGGTNNFSFFQSSVSLNRILPRLTEDNSLVSVSMTLLRVMYCMVWKKNIKIISTLYNIYYNNDTIHDSLKSIS